MQSKSHTTQLLTMALLIALEIMFTRFLSINTPILRIGFGFLPIAMIAILYGPVWAGLCYAVGDVLGMMIFPSGPFFPGFTVSALLTGITFGLVLYRKPVTWKRTLIASIIVVVGINLCLDTVWLTILMNKGFMAMLPVRIIKTPLAIAVQTILIPLVWHQVMARLSH